MSIHHHETTEPTMSVLSDREAHGLMRSLVLSRRWWTIPIANAQTLDLLAEIEQRYYPEGTSEDFLIIIGPFPTALARKTRMSPEELANVLVEAGAVPASAEADWAKALRERDILATLGSEADDAEMAARLTLWHAWVTEVAA